MRIGVVTASYPRFAGDAAGNFVGAHVTAMRALGHHVDVIAAGEPDASDVIRIPSRLFYRGGAPEALERRGSLFAAASFTARLAIAVARRARHWELIVAHWLAPSALAALPVRTPLLAIGHGGDVHTLARMQMLGPVLAAWHARRARLAFVADELLAIARHHAPITDAVVQPMGIDVAHFAAIGRAPTTPPMIVVLARLVPVKGVDVAIAAMRHVRADARLVIAGDGPERHTLARDPRVTFVGEVAASTRDRLLREASIVVIPSRVLPSGRTEGTPLVALEALAANVPVIASAVGGLRALAVTHVAPDDPAGLATAIDRVLGSPPRELAATVAHLDWPFVAERLLAHAEKRPAR